MKLFNNFPKRLLTLNKNNYQIEIVFLEEQCWKEFIAIIHFATVENNPRDTA